MQQYLPGKTIKGYEIREFVGEGGFGAVYRAFQLFVKREVAIKVILPEFANQPDFVRRFELEAQLVARLEHPHIVPLYDYWREGSYAYLVMRVLPTNLGTALVGGVWSLDRIAALLDQIAGALQMAHRNGVLHRDIKPDNILLDGDHNAYLADFGIASIFDQDAQAFTETFGLGSLAYVAPEQLRGQPLTNQADLFSLGVLIYEMLTGRLPFGEVESITDLIDKQLEVPFPPLARLRKGLPNSLDAFIQRATDKKPVDRFPDALSMAAAFRQALAGVISTGTLFPSPLEAADAEVVQNPYKGLRAFQEADSADFFGRETLVEDLLKRLAEAGDDGRFLAVIGPSGSGKSSVVHAGLLPAIRRGRLPGSEHWFIADMRPGPHPFDNLSAAILGVAVKPSASTVDDLRSDMHGLARVIQRVLPPEPNIELLLIIDQFEEVFTLVKNETERLAFLNSLVNAVTDLKGRLCLVLTLRADFVDRPLQYAAFGEMIRKHNEFVLPLSPQELEQAIIRPVERLGVGVGIDLVTTILAEVAEHPNALPLLEYALTELFERRKGGPLTLATYHEIGGVLGILARQAEELYIRLDAEGQIATRQMFMRLVTPGEGTNDTRRRVGRVELASLAVTQEALDGAIDAFSRRRLLTFDTEVATRRPTVEIAHEALILAWSRLQEWLNTSREDIRIQRRLMMAASEWINAGREASFLADGARLDLFEIWSQQTSLALGSDETAYLDASIQQQAERQAADEARKAQEARTARLAANFQRATLVLAVVGLLALVALVFLGVQARQAEAQVSQADDLVATAQSRLTGLGLAAEANKILLSSAGNVELASLLSIRALNTAYIAEADSTLRQSIERNYTQLIYRENTGAVYGVAFSPDGKYAASGGMDNVARLWNVKTGKTLQVFRGHTAGITSLAFGSDGKTILTGSKDTTARLWDVQTGKTLRVFTFHILPDFQPGNDSDINVVAISPEGKYVATGSRDFRVRLWDAKTGEMLKTFLHTQGIFGLAFSPDSTYLLAASTDRAAILWDIRTGSKVQTFKGHTGSIWCVAISPDGKTVLTGSGDNTARLWDIQTGQMIHIFKGHFADVTGVIFSRDGKSIVTTSSDATARLWDVETGQALRIFSGHIGAVWSPSLSPDGKQLLTGGDDQTVRVWDSQVDVNPYVFASHTASVWGVAFSSDGTQILTGSDDMTAQLWDRQTKQALRAFADQKTPVYCLAFSPDGRYVLTGTSGGLSELWDAHTGTKVRNFQTEATTSIYAVAFTPDVKYAIVGGVDSAAHLWDVQTGDAVRNFAGHSGPIDAEAISPDGKYLLTGSYDHTARLWNIPTGDLVYILSDHTDSVNSVAFSPDGKFVLTGSGDSSARLWDAQSGKLIRIFVGQTSGVTSVAFSPDGKFVAAGSSGALLLLWDVATGQIVRTFEGHTNGIASVTFSPDGKYVLSGSTDHTVRLWETNFHDFVAYACTRLSHDFSDDERVHYKLTDALPTCPQFASPPGSATASPAS